jgi:hypothetical protein
MATPSGWMLGLSIEKTSSLKGDGGDSMVLSLTPGEPMFFGDGVCGGEGRSYIVDVSSS